MRNMNLNDLISPVQLTMIATYVYLRCKQSQGQQLLPAEATLLNGRIKDSALCMLLSNNAAGGAIQPPMNLEEYIYLTTSNLIAHCGAEVQLDLNSLYQEMLAKIPFSSARFNSEIQPDGTILILSRIRTSYGTIVKCYKYHTVSLEEMLDILIEYDNELMRILENLRNYPDVSSWVEFFKDELLDAYCYHIFGRDYEYLYRYYAEELPPMLLHQLETDIWVNLRGIQEVFYVR